MNFLETADAGSITVAGETLWSADDARTQSEAVLRKKRLHFGLVFQNFNLFPQYTALQNVMLAGELLAKERPDYKQNRKQIHDELETHARELLAQMGLSDWRLPSTTPAISPKFTAAASKLCPKARPRPGRCWA